MSRSSARDLVRVGGADVAPDAGRARRQPGRVDQALAGEPQPARAGNRSDDFHERGDGELR